MARPYDHCAFIQQSASSIAAVEPFGKITVENRRSHSLSGFRVKIRILQHLSDLRVASIHVVLLPNVKRSKYNVIWLAFRYRSHGEKFVWAITRNGSGFIASSSD
jgi:hypothetical protein